MSLETVMKNVYTFAEILGQASGQQAGLWDLQALNNALKWAAYCQQINDHVKDDRIKKSLDRKLLEMAIMLEPAGSVCLSVDLLGQASDLLQKTLLQNSHTSDTVVRELLSKRKSTERDLLKQFSDLILRQGAVDIPAEILNFIEDSSSLEASSNDCCVLELSGATSPVVTSQAALMIRTLLTHHNMPQSEVNHMLQRVACLKHGWAILVCMVYVGLRFTPDKEAMSAVRSDVVQWMISFPENYLNLWLVPTSMVMKAATASSQFCGLYLDVLGELANQMEAEYHQLTNGRLYTWRSQMKDVEVGFDDLVNRYQLLLNSGVDIRRCTVVHLTHRAEKSCFNIWRDICRQLH